MARSRKGLQGLAGARYALAGFVFGLLLAGWTRWPVPDSASDMPLPPAAQGPLQPPPQKLTAYIGVQVRVVGAAV